MAKNRGNGPRFQNAAKETASKKEANHYALLQSRSHRTAKRANKAPQNNQEVRKVIPTSHLYKIRNKETGEVTESYFDDLNGPYKQYSGIDPKSDDFSMEQLIEFNKTYEITHLETQFGNETFNTAGPTRDTTKQVSTTNFSTFYAPGAGSS